MNAHVSKVSIQNSAGGLPLYMACCKEYASSSIVKILLEIHKGMDLDIPRLDRNEDSPFYITMQTKAPHTVVLELFHSWDTTDAFAQHDKWKISSSNGIDRT